MTFPPIEQLLPHQAPMLLLDRVTAFAAQSISCETRVGERHALLLDAQGNLPGWCGIELMAQAIAAWAGLQAHQLREPVRIGMLLGTRKYESQLPTFAAGSLLRIEAHCLLQDAGMASFECRILQGETLCAKARLSTYQPTTAQLSDLLETQSQ
ncbi:thioester dehydrase [Aeromonas enteropelogenes]|uniref:Hotdog family protein n=1 Tax=Aeromonas sp. 19NY04SH05-1 TaxID=2920537 RepID=A0AAU6TB12_9GAMM|nr:thioester dehydrase [Aeromonas enteropelogenes]BEE20690.1 thioester dehydrase [Aeromonas enteropelogenes]